MDRSILEQLFNGEIAPNRDFEPKLESLKTQRGLAHGSYENFSKKLDEYQQKEFDSVMDKYVDLLPLEMTTAFISGFRLGVLIMLETVYQTAEIKE